MVKIISPGKLPGERVYRATCSYCHCHFEFFAKEAQYTSDQREGDAYKIACPTEGCGRPVYVDACKPVVYRSAADEYDVQPGETDEQRRERIADAEERKTAHLKRLCSASSDARDNVCSSGDVTEGGTR